MNNPTKKKYFNRFWFILEMKDREINELKMQNEALRKKLKASSSELEKREAEIDSGTLSIDPKPRADETICLDDDEPKDFDSKMSSNDEIICLDEELKTSNCSEDSDQLLDQSMEMDSAERPLNSTRIEDEGSKSLELIEQSETSKLSPEKPDPKLKRAKVS